jgi:hypothetical protein
MTPAQFTAAAVVVVLVATAGALWLTSWLLRDDR